LIEKEQLAARVSALERGWLVNPRGSPVRPGRAKVALTVIASAMDGITARRMAEQLGGSRRR
jgi:hypothetical protein